MTQNSSQLGHHHDKRTSQISCAATPARGFRKEQHTSSAHHLRWYLGYNITTNSVNPDRVSQLVDAVATHIVHIVVNV